MAAVVVPECTGGCCAVFSLSLSAGELRRRAHRLVDGEQIADMVIELDVDEAIERCQTFDVDPDRIHVNVLQSRLFTCRHWDEQTRRCSIYDERPGMCRNFPYGTPCHLCGATGCEAGPDPP